MGALGIGPELSLRRHPVAAPVFEFGTGVLPSGANLTRASGGRRWDSGGVSVVEASDVARFDYDPATLVYRGLLLEAARTNLLLRSAEFDNASWAMLRMAIGANAGTGPDGTAAADKLVPTTTAGSHYVQQSATFTLGTSYALTVYLKPAGYRYARVSLPSQAFPSANRAGFFDLIAGTVTGAESGVTATIEAAGGGWYRCAVARAATVSASGDCGIAVNQSATQSLESWSGNGTDGVLAWGAQLEVGAGASSHIATTNASVARAADVLVLDWASRGVGNGTVTVRHTFDDGSTQDVGVTVAGGTAAVPAGLNRPWLRRVEKI